MQQERFLLHRKESLTEEPSLVSDVGDQLLEYDSNASATHEEGDVEAVPEKFLHQGHRAHASGRPIKLSYRVVSPDLQIAFC